MKPSGEEEYQRLLGFRASLWPWLDSDKEAAHRSGNGSRGRFPVVRHPIAWVRWRMAVRREGPFAPEFKDFY
jgi:hypothetical protein